MGAQRLDQMLQNAELIGLRNIAAALVLLVAVCLPLGAEPAEIECPANLTDATRLILVVAPDVNTSAATVQLIERRSPGASWQKVGAPKRSVIGRGGIGWAWTFASLASDKEPIKKEGDGRTPAGVFALGKVFGFDAEKASNYVRLEKGKTFCVDDSRSPYYNTIVPKTLAGQGTSGEDMRTIPLYRHGLFIDYPTSRETKGGSCIFIHVWRSPASSTSGCVALAEPDIIDIQEWAEQRPTLVGLFWQNAFNRMSACFPGL